MEDIDSEQEREKMTRKALIAIVAVAALTVAGRIAYAAIPDAGGAIHACY